MASQNATRSSALTQLLGAIALGLFLLNFVSFAATRWESWFSEGDAHFPEVALLPVPLAPGLTADERAATEAVRREMHRVHKDMLDVRREQRIHVRVAPPRTLVPLMP